MKLPNHFYKPLAIGAPAPFRELPVRAERMIHFFPPHVDKIRARIPETARQVDVLCGNLEDAIPAEAKEAARSGFIEVARKTELGYTSLWVRVNALNSPWFLDDMLQIVAAAGNKVERDDYPQGRRHLGHPLRRPVTGPARSQTRSESADPDSRLARDGPGGQECQRHRGRQPADAWNEPGAGRPRRLARNEDDAGRRRPPVLRRAGRCRPRQRRPGVFPARPVALHDRPHGQRLCLLRPARLLWAVRRFSG